MKKISFLFLMILLVGTSHSQSSRTRSSQRTVNGVTEGWVVKETLDAAGNVIDYDSSYNSNEDGLMKHDPNSQVDLFFLDPHGSREDSMMNPFPFSYFNDDFDSFFSDTAFVFRNTQPWDTTFYFGFGPDGFSDLDSLFRQEGFTPEMRELLRKYGIDPDSFERDQQETAPADIPKSERI